MKAIKFDGEENPNNPLFFEIDAKNLNKLQNDLSHYKEEIILIDFELYLLLSSLHSFSIPTFNVNEDVKNCMYVGNFIGKHIFQDFGGTLQKYEYMVFSDIKTMYSKLENNNRLEKLMRILDEDDI